MLLGAVIVCCAIIVNAESPLNSHSYTGDSNGYDYSNTGTNNGYLGSKDSYQNGGHFYAGGNHEVSNYVGGQSSLINPVDNQGNIEGDSYSGYSSSNNNHESEYAGYSNTYENSNSDSYILSTRATPTSFRGYSNNNGDSGFKPYPSDSSIYKDSDFGNQYATGSTSVNSKRIPYSAGYSRPTTLKNYHKGSVDSESLQGYHDSTDVSSYSENDHVYSSYLPDNLAGEHSFGKQRDGPYGLKSGGKYGNVYPTPSETRYTRGNTGNVGNVAGHASYNHDIPSYASRPSNYVSKTPGVYISSGKPNKYYGYSKYLTRHAPNSGMTYYLSRDRDDYYAPSSYGKSTGKVLIIKNNRPGYDGGHVYNDEPLYSSGYRSKSGGLVTGYPASPTFDGYNAGGNGYDDSSTLTRRYRNSGVPMLVQRSIYSL
ncbi:probable serine/threonine-protein kinase clkA [Pseudomyrmex gracilis]|uniref:probable serine/threonine-protein kinase clkA n=1 Tax=Pseudomyrmex gracilis TaxID=219809 RepID=UPI0009958F77|nr:probable serine/threonine-protein kinase clkA [Pseudomyrmex gracilis]